MNTSHTTTIKKVPVPFKPVGAVEWLRRMKINWECRCLDYRCGTGVPFYSDGRYFDNYESLLAFEAEILGRVQTTNELVKQIRKLKVAVTTNFNMDLSPRELLDKFPDEVEVYDLEIGNLEDEKMLGILAYGLICKNDWVANDCRSEWWVES